jgi:class 3 adenylate cyclase
MMETAKLFYFGPELKKTINIKIGIHYGPAIAGVIGHHKP